MKPPWSIRWNSSMDKHIPSEGGFTSGEAVYFRNFRRSLRVWAWGLQEGYAMSIFAHSSLSILKCAGKKPQGPVPVGL